MSGIVVAVGVGVVLPCGVCARRMALTGRGQSCGVSGYSIGLSAMYSSGRLLWKGVGRFVEGTSVSEWRPSFASESESLYQMVPLASICIPDLITRGICSGISSIGGVSGEVLGVVIYAGSSPAICGGSSPGSSAGPSSPGSSAIALPASSIGAAPPTRRTL